MIKAGALGRFRWAVRTGRKPLSPLALPRMWWHDFVIHVLFEGTERCQDCGRGYVCWGAPAGLWREVYGSGGGLLCPLCFERRAEAMGIIVRFEATVLRRTAA